jgi:protein kinase C substrate 80K-H
LPGFYCNNKGHRPSYIPFTYVNDGVCDYDLCCDGSDEWESVGGIVCENRCKEIGKEWRKQDEQRKRALESGQKARKELIQQALRLRMETEHSVETLQAEIGALKARVGDLEAQLADVERKEKTRLLKGPVKGGKINVLANIAKGRIEELRTALIDVRNQRDVALTRIQELEAILNKFQEEYNPNFNDEGVKRAVRSWEEFVARKNSNPDPDHSAQDRDLDEFVKPDSEESGIRWEEWEGGEESDVDVCKSLPFST